MFPNSILETLAKRLCDSLGINYPSQKNTTPVKGHPKTGFIDLVKPSKAYSSQEKEIADIVKSFYTDQGFTVENSKTVLYARKPKESYTIMIIEHERTYSLWITDSLSISRK